MVTDFLFDLREEGFFFVFEKQVDLAIIAVSRFPEPFGFQIGGMDQVVQRGVDYVGFHGV